VSFVFLHGFAGSPRVFAPWRARLGGVAPTLLGHGAESDATTFDDEVDRLAAQVKDRAVWVGYSMGGRLALGVAARHPERVARLVLIAAHPGLEDPNERARRRAEDEARARTLETEGLDAFFRGWDALPMFARRTPPRRDGLDAHELSRAMRVLSTGAMTPRWDTLALHDLTYVVGEHDAAYRALAAHMLARAPHARVTIVPGADHDVLGCGDDARRVVESLLDDVALERATPSTPRSRVAR
jgi:2-succinyl-6-hydroxy-2,4-cyclohexadiene-1-carboxylate synthase